MRWQCRLDLSDLVWLVGELVLLSVRCRVKHRVENAHEKSPTKAACSQVEYRCRQRCDVKCGCMWVVLFFCCVWIYISLILYIYAYMYIVIYAWYCCSQYLLLIVNYSATYSAKAANTNSKDSTVMRTLGLPQVMGDCGCKEFGILDFHCISLGELQVA